MQCNSSLIEAVQNNDVLTLECVIFRAYPRFDANHVYNGKQTILHLAVGREHLQIVKLLLNHGGDVNLCELFAGNSCLHIAAKTRNLALLDAILALTKNVDLANRRGLTALHRAVKYDRYEIAMHLLRKAKADVNTQNCDGECPLHEAVWSKNYAMIELLLRHGADPNCANQNGVTPFHEMIKLDELRLMDLLLRHGASLQAKDDNGYNAMHYAVKFGAFKILRKLLTLRLDVEERTKYGQRTPLHLLSECLAKPFDEVMSIARLLVENGADVNAIDKYGKTLLMKAVKLRQLEMVRGVLSLGADPNVHETFSTLHYAVSRSSADIVECLVDCGAKVGYLDPFDRSLLNTAMRRRGDNDDGVMTAKIVELLMERGVVVRDKDNLELNDRQFQVLKKCEQQLKLLRTTKVCVDYSTTYYDILTGRRDALVSRLRNKRVVDAIKSGRYKEKFEHFVERVEVNFSRGLERMRVLDRAVNALCDLFGEVFDWVIINRISQYFDGDDYDLLLMGYDDSD